MSLILEKYVVVIEYFPVSFKILEYFKIAHLKIIDYTEHSTIKNKQCKWIEQCIDLFHLKQFLQ